MNERLKELIDEKGMAAEYHVNSTLHLELGAVRYIPGKAGQDAILFDGMLLPSPSKKGRSQPFTEVDHLLISRKGIFAIETKSISGKVFGERESKKWNSAKPSDQYKDGLYDRGFTNPFKQNGFHIAAISSVLKEGGHRAWVSNIVVLVNADAAGWEEGSWGSDTVKDLFLSADDFVTHVESLDDVLTIEDVSSISESFYPYYLATEGNMAVFKSYHN